MKDQGNTLVQSVTLINSKSNKVFSSSTIETGLNIAEVIGIENIVLEEAEGVNKADDANTQGDYVITNELIVVGSKSFSQKSVYVSETAKEAYAFCQALINVARKANSMK